MASRLSSLLVRDGLVSVKRMERAFQRQVIYGGALDTILLEMKLVPEDRLVQYLSLATGLPPATDGEGAEFEDKAAASCPRPVAEKYRIVPLSFEEDALRILVSEPVDLDRLEDLANELELPIQPLVAPEYRFELAFSMLFGEQADARYSKVAELAGSSRASAGEAEAVAVEGSAPEFTRFEPTASQAAEKAEQAAAEQAAAERAAAERAAAERAAAERAAAERAAAEQAAAEQAAAERAAAERAAAEQAAAEQAAAERAAAERAAVQPIPNDPTERTVIPVPTNGEPELPAGSTMELNTDSLRQQIADEERDARQTRARRESEAPVPEPVSDDSQPTVIPVSTGPGIVVAAPLRKRPPTIESEPVDVSAIPDDLSPLAPHVARAALEAADDRDAIFTLLLRAIRNQTSYAALLTVQGGAAIGRVAISGGELDKSVTQVLIPLDGDSAFKQAVGSASPYIGKVATGDREIDSMVARLGGNLPPAALLLPIALRGRVVALAVGHRGSNTVSIAEVSPLLPLAGVAADAVSRLLVKAKARAPKKSKGNGTVSSDDPEDDRTTGRYRRLDESELESAPPAETTPKKKKRRRSKKRKKAVPEAPVAERPISKLFDEIESRDKARSENAIREALGRAEDSIQYLGERFPGKLRTARYDSSGRVLRAAQHGSVLDLVVRLGAPTADLLVDKMRAGDKDVRYYATVCASELRPVKALAALVERLFDSDYAIRGIAVDALIGYPTLELDNALDFARRALDSEQPARVKAASEALARLSDIRAIPGLLEAISRKDSAADAVRRALVDLAKQDFGTSPKKWRSWWKKNQSRSRIEWILDGLVHKDAEIRRSAAEDLRKLTGENFGYHHDLSKKDRDQAQKRWLQWWSDVGKRRFLRAGDSERHRPTAVLPKAR